MPVSDRAGWKFMFETVAGMVRGVYGSDGAKRVIKIDDGWHCMMIDAGMLTLSLDADSVIFSNPVPLGLQPSRTQEVTSSLHTFSLILFPVEI